MPLLGPEYNFQEFSGSLINFF